MGSTPIRGRGAALARAAWGAAVYLVVASLYIVLSTRYVASLGLSPQQLERIELYKGIGFVLVTAVTLLALLTHHYRRHETAEAALAERAAEVARAQQQASVAAVAGAAGHDMKNVVTVLRNVHAELGRDASDDEERAELLEDVESSLGRLEELAKQLMDLARSDGRRLEDVELGRLARECARMSRFFVRQHACAIQVHATAPCRVRVDRRELSHVVLNLLLNAIEAMESRGTIDVTVRKEGDRAVLRVADHGPGVPRGLRERIFEPFFTTKEERGTGLGLSVARDVVRHYEGELRLVDADAGAVFEVELRAPVAASAAT